MDVPSSTSAAAPPPIPATEGAPRGTGSSNHGTVPTSFDDLVDVVVTGAPTEQQLHEIKAQFREINSTEAGATMLRELRRISRQHGHYPMLAFTEGTPNALPTLRLPENHRSSAPLEAPDENPALEGRNANPDEVATASSQAGVAGLTDIEAFCRAVAIVSDMQGHLNLQRLSAQLVRMLDHEPIPMGNWQTAGAPGPDATVYGIAAAIMSYVRELQPAHAGVQPLPATDPHAPGRLA